MKKAFALGALTLVSACSDPNHIGREPAFTPAQEQEEHTSMVYGGLPPTTIRRDGTAASSLWTGGKQSLFGDRRALQRGDILTVVIEIDDKAEIQNNTATSRKSSQDMSVPHLLGIPQRANQRLPEGASMENAIGVQSGSENTGKGSVRRKEKLALRVAATVVEVLPNGVLAISGRQEVRVNFELRELLVTGYVRPADVSRQNQITYDKIASARISYGGRGHISNVQQPRWGQQILDFLLPL